MIFSRVAVASLLLAGSSTAAGQDFDNGVIRVETIGEGLYVLLSEGGRTTGNLLVSIGEDGVLLVDSQLPEIVPHYRAKLAELGGDKVDLVINTHWHYDHADGNELLGAEGTRFVAHENSRAMMTVDKTIGWGNESMEQPAYERHAWPVITYDNTMGMHFNGNRINLMHFGAAHTTGDTVVVLPEHNLAHMGDVFNRRGFPFIDAGNGGSLDGMIAFCQAVLEVLQPGATVIPGHGQISDYETLERYVEMLIDVRKIIAELIDEGLTLEQIVAAEPLSRWDEEFGDPTRDTDILRMIDRAFASLSPLQ